MIWPSLVASLLLTQPAPEVAVPPAAAGAAAVTDVTAPARRPPPPDYTDPLTDTQVDQATTIIRAMHDNPRGPYAGISWFCNDGTEQLPRLNGCVEHGGGKMYGVFSLDGKRLLKMGVFVGTVLSTLTYPDLAESDYYRARALVVEKYLERALDGWVLKSAKSYRGFRQDEDEADGARELLMALARDKRMLDSSRALLIRLSRALPYGRGNEGQAIEIRALAAVIGDADPAFAKTRFKIHALPEPSDIALVEAYLPVGKSDMHDNAVQLIEMMRRYYDPVTRLARLKEVRQWVGDLRVKKAIDTFAATDPQNTPDLITQGLLLMDVAEKPIHPTTDLRQGERNLLLLHTMNLVEELWLATTADLARRPLTRSQALELVRSLVLAANHVGMLSSRETGAALTALVDMQTADAGRYARGVATLARSLEWARARVLADVGLPLQRYQAIEPQAPAVVDDILRSGVMLPLATLLDRLSQDAENVRGAAHRLIGVTGSTASLRGENPGIAVGHLRVVKPGASSESLGRDDVALLFDLPPELPPVAGVITVGAVGSLSHVALLARNLGIPLAAVGGDVATALEKLQGQDVVVGVSQNRRVAIGLVSALSDADRILVNGPKKQDITSLTIDSSRLDLKTARILSISEVSEADAGIRVGPKAAELGRLHRLFPTRVSDAAVIPFGVFLRHVDDGSSTSPLANLRVAYKQYQEAVKRPGNEDAAQTEILAALARFRDLIMTRPFPPGFEEEVTQALKRLGEINKFGVYVRSDTNVEDLKDFTGAGLNLTVFNKVWKRDILQSIREVWASPYSERSFKWRQKLLTNPEFVFPSVLLHKTVPSEMSGVMVTMDLETLNTDAATVSIAQGVSAVVDGGAPETVVLEPNGNLRLIASFNSATRKVVPKVPLQGVKVEVAVPKDPLLSDRDITEVRGLLAEILEKVPPKQAGLPWDIEFGMVHGKAYLMQLRPLKLSKSAATHPYLVSLDASAPTAQKPLDLQGALP